MQSHAKYHQRRSLNLLSVHEAAEYLGISSRSIRRHVANGDLPHRRIGWLIKLERSALEAFAVQVGGPGKGGRR